MAEYYWRYLNGQLIHSAKGTTWSKKDHKYIRKEGGKYIYPDRFKGKYTYHYKDGEAASGVYVNNKTGKTMEYEKRDGVNYIKPQKSRKTKNLNILERAGLKISAKIQKAIRKIKDIKLSSMRVETYDYDQSYTTAEAGRKMASKIGGMKSRRKKSNSWSRWRIGKDTKNSVNAIGG